jgi:uncharacterized damage-inducible protein DinB
MEETNAKGMDSQRISKLFSDLYDGNAWIDVTIVGTLKNIKSNQAYSKPAANLNSIWEIVNHLVSWRETVLKRMQGETINEPKNNFFEPVKENSGEAWRNTLTRFEKSQQMWLQFLSRLDDKSLEKYYSQSKYTYYDLMLGILQHDAYHLGQIVLLKKMVG